MNISGKDKENNEYERKIMKKIICILIVFGCFFLECFAQDESADNVPVRSVDENIVLVESAVKKTLQKPGWTLLPYGMIVKEKPKVVN